MGGTRKKQPRKINDKTHKHKKGGSILANLRSRIQERGILKDNEASKRQFDKIALKEIKDDYESRMEYLGFLSDKVDVGLKACSLKTESGMKMSKLKNSVLTTLGSFVSEIEGQIDAYQSSLRKINLALTKTANAPDWLLEFRNSDARVLSRLDKTLDYYKQTQRDIIAGVIEDKTLCTKKVVAFHLKRLRKDIVFASGTRRNSHKQKFERDFPNLASI